MGNTPRRNAEKEEPKKYLDKRPNKTPTRSVSRLDYLTKHTSQK